MTPLQDKALIDVKHILNSNFDAFVLTTRSCDEFTSDSVNTDWHGSLSDVIGLNHISGKRLDAIALNRLDEEIQ